MFRQNEPGQSQFPGAGMTASPVMYLLRLRDAQSRRGITAEMPAIAMAFGYMAKDRKSIADGEGDNHLGLTMAL
jgi:hypothetical protein